LNVRRLKTGLFCEGLGDTNLAMYDQYQPNRIYIVSLVVTVVRSLTIKISRKQVQKPVAMISNRRRWHTDL